MVFSRKAITRMQAVIIAAIVIIAAMAGVVYYYTMSTEKQYITLATWGGDYLNAISPIVQAFSKETGIEVRYFIQGSSGETAIKIVAEKDNPTIDLFESGTAPVVSRLVPAGMCAPITSDKVPNLQYMSDQARALTPDYLPIFENFEGWMIYPDIIPAEHAYNGSVKWFFDPALENRLAVCPTSWGLSAQSFCYMAYGLGLAQNTTDINAGIQVAKLLAPNIRLVYASEAEIAQLFASKEVWAAYGLFTTAKTCNDAGVPVQALKVIPDLITAAEYNPMVVVKGGKEDLARQFLNYFIKPENLAEYSYALGYTPMNRDPLQPPANLQAYLLSGDELEHSMVTNYKWSASILDVWATRWDTEVKPLL